MQAMIYRTHQLKAITGNQYQYMMWQVCFDVLLG